MAVIRWRNPREFFSIQEEINRMFDNMLGAQGRDDDQMRLAPLSDVVENKDDYMVSVELPGMKKEDVKISLRNNSLTVSGEKKKEFESKDETYHRVERAFGAFNRTFVIPSEVDSSKIKAEFKDGILTVQLPKVEAAKPKEIPIMVK